MVEGNNIVGCVLVEGEHMKSLYVLPEYMGRGIGAKLAQIAEDCIKENGYEFVILWSSLISEEFYKHRDYEFVKDIEDDHGRVLHKEMRKRL